jgi:hypothetical protein
MRLCCSKVHREVFQVPYTAQPDHVFQRRHGSRARTRQGSSLSVRISG